MQPTHQDIVEPVLGLPVLLQRRESIIRCLVAAPDATHKSSQYLEIDVIIVHYQDMKIDRFRGLGC
jgi:hypothetical protein